MSGDSQKTILLIDGSSFLYRAYHALRPMHTSNGETTQAVFGFCRMIKKVLRDFSPQHIAVVWDSKGKTVRHELYHEYKATRQAAPSDLFTQKDLIQEFAQIIQLPQIEKSGIEADDLIYSCAKDALKHHYSVIIISSDKDLGQILAPHVKLYDPFKEDFITRATLEEKYGFDLEKLPFYFALVGDTSDNIPGVAGIGPKTATDLVKQFGSLKDLYNNLEKVPKERTRQLLEKSKENAFLSEKLFQLHYHDTHFDAKRYQFDEKNWASARAFFEKLEFASLLKELPLQEHTVHLAPRVEFDAITVTTQQQFEEVLSAIEKAGEFAIDTETDGGAAYQATLVGLSLCYEKGRAFYVPLQHVDAHGSLLADQLPVKTVVSALQDFFARERIKKYLQNAKYDALVLAHAGAELGHITFDTLIAASLVTLDAQKIGLKSLSQRYLHQSMLSFEDVVKKKGRKTFAQVPLDEATVYAAADAHQTFSLVPILEKELEKYDMHKLFYELEMPVNYVLYFMEREGIALDPTVLKKADHYVTRGIEKLREAIIDLIGHKFKDINLNSPKQLEQLLFEHLKLVPVKKTGQKTGFSTDAEVLKQLAREHPVPGLVLKYRELVKLKNTYIDALPTYMDSENKIHTTFSQTSVATGRLSSFDPNLQNIPLEGGVREAFVPPAGHVFLSADYSQIELRVLAQLSGDKNLCAAFDRGEDIHARTAAHIFDVAIDAVTHDQRQLAKRINFSILYGLTPYGLSKDIGISVSDAKKYIEKYFEQYPGVVAWMEGVIEETKKLGYTVTLGGRRRAVPGIYEKNQSLYNAACRIAINTRAQGTAAELMKVGMINIFHELFTHKLGAKILLQIHDELIFTVPRGEVRETVALVTRVLQSSVHWRVPLVVTTRTGENWHEVTK